LRGQGTKCDWARVVDMSFTDNVFRGGSYNLPVVAAAVAYIKQPVRSGWWNMNTFWDTYLRGELGDRGGLWYYGATEIGSYDYHHHNVVAVLAVHYWAHTRVDTNIETLARRWLRATFALHALAAMPQQPLTLNAKGQVRTATTNVTGPYVAMAGERSASGFWMYPDRNIMFAKAAGLATNASNESNPQEGVRGFIENAWPGPAAYGLTTTDRARLQAAVNSGTLIPNLKTDFLGNLHTHSRYQIAAWPNAKAVVLEASRNTNTVPTIGTAYFLDTRQAHFLYPWSGLFGGGSEFKNGVCTGTAFMDLSAHLMQAYHPTCPNGGKPIKHPEETTYIHNLPAATPNYVVTLDPTASPVCTPACP
jgi:hypothetical protein